MTIKNLPKFKEHIEYSELHPYTGSYKYRYITLKELTIHHNFKLEKTFRYISGNKVWLRITPQSIIISSDYNWDGCKPKKWWGFWWGTPDSKETALASLVHDALLQFHHEWDFPFSREYIDLIFKDILKHSGFRFWWLYYNVVKGYTYVTSKKR